MLAFRSEDPKRDQNLQFTPTSKRDDEHPRHFHIGDPLPRAFALACTKRDFLSARHVLAMWPT